MRAPTYDEVQLLKLVSGEPCKTINQDDDRLAPYCSDDSTLTNPDTFNRCLDMGWLKAWHDSDSSSSTAELTKDGARVLCEPRPYDLAHEDERRRLFREAAGYLHVCRKCGGDFDGRRFAREAFEALAEQNPTHPHRES